MGRLGVSTRLRTSKVNRSAGFEIRPTRAKAMARVVIVGAGIAGLALAYRLYQLVPAAEITILEQRDRPGGTIWTERRQGFQVEIGPDGFLDNKPTTLKLCRNLGLADQLLPASEGSARNPDPFLG